MTAISIMHVLGYHNPIRFEMAAREKVQHHRLCAIRSRLEDNPINAERARTGGMGDTEKQTGSSPEFATQGARVGHLGSSFSGKTEVNNWITIISKTG